MSPGAPHQALLRGRTYGFRAIQRGRTPTVGTRTLIARVDELRWHAAEDDQVIGRGEASRRPDGRIFLSIETWHGAVFDRLAASILADLAGPLYTLVGEADRDIGGVSGLLGVNTGALFAVTGSTTRARLVRGGGNALGVGGMQARRLHLAAVSTGGGE